MTDSIKNVIIIGAGGNLGPSILESLDTDPYFSVSVLSRKGSSSKFPSHVKVFQIDESYPEDQLHDAFKGQDGVVLLLPPNEVEKQKRIIDVAIKAGVKRLIPGEFGSDTTKQEVIDAVPIFSHKVEIVKYLQSKEDTGLSWSAIITGGFFDWGLNSGLLGFDLKAHKATIFDQGEVQSNFTLLSTIGKAVAETFKHSAKTANKYLFINSYHINQQELFSSLKKATPGQEWTTEHVSSEATEKEGFEKLGKGDFSGILLLIQAAIYGKNPKQDYTLHEELANDILGLPKPGPLDEVVAKIVKGEKV